MIFHTQPLTPTCLQLQATWGLYLPPIVALKTVESLEAVNAEINFAQTTFSDNGDENPRLLILPGDRSSGGSG